METTNAGELSKFCKNVLRKSAKMHYFSLFYTKFYKPSVNSFRVWTKNTKWWGIFDEISIENLTIKKFVEKMLLKMEPSEITSFFYNNISNFGGGRVPGVPPCYATFSLVRLRSAEM